MSNNGHFRRKSLIAEVIFFLFFFVLGGPLSCLEYFILEGHVTVAEMKRQMVSYLFYGFSDLIPYGLFYIFAVRRLLLNRRFLPFVFSVPAFLLFLNCCKIFTYWLLAHLPLLPAEIRDQAAGFLTAKVPVHFSVVYVFRDVLAIVALGYFIHSAEQEKRMADLQRIQAETELVQLKAQVHPHYFFNTLNSIYALSVKQSPLTSVLVARHAEMMRYMLYEANKDKVRLSDEVRFIEAYTDIEKVRQSGKRSILLETQGIDEQTRIEPLIMLPFVENAFKHGIEANIEAGFVKIVVCRLEDELLFEVRNSCSVPKGNEPAPGIGLLNIRKRLGHLYPGRHHLQVQQHGMEFQISLSLKLIA